MTVRKTFILTEKPSVAMDFAKALNVQSRQDGYLESDQYIITWAVGHLLGLFEPEDYNPSFKQWSFGSLPILPDEFKYKPLDGSKKQLSVISKLLERADLGAIVIATDAGREGEVIARTVLYHSYKTNGIPIKRFWSSQALTPSVVQAEINSLKPAAQYDRLWQAGQTRQIADWLIGMNCTRATTLALGELFTVGRVQTATLALLVDRARERENFTKKFYYVVLADFEKNGNTWRGTWTGKKGERLDTQQEASAIVSKTTNAPGRVSEYKQDLVKEAPPLLYSLTELQRAANQKYGLTAAKTLSIAQDLYEKEKCISYPRTDARVMGTGNVSLAQSLVASLSKSYSSIFKGVSANLIALSNKRVFDDSKLTDHHALIPLKALPSTAGDFQRKIYDRIMRRFAAAFHPDYQFTKKTLDIEVNWEIFRSTGKSVVSEGWHVLYPDPSDSSLPDIHVGEDVEVKKVWTEERETLPPPHYTEASLLRDMSNPAKYIEDKALQGVFRKGEAGLGTQATRAGIIENLIDRGYVQRQKKSLIATDKAKLLIDFLRGFNTGKVLASPQETARWEQNLEAIARGNQGSESFLINIRSFVSQIIEDCVKKKPQRVQETKGNAIGLCPLCGREVIENKKAFSCCGWKEGCQFAIWKTICSRRMSVTEAQRLLSEGYIGPFDGFISKGGRSFTATLRLENGRISFDFEKQQKAAA